MSNPSTMEWPGVPATAALPPLPPRSPVRPPSSSHSPGMFRGDVSQPTDSPTTTAHGSVDEDIAWHRRATDSDKTSSVKASLSSDMDAKPSKPSLLQRAKKIVCKMPNPTLFFIFEVCMVLALHVAKPHLLRTWVARIITPLCLIPTVVATALWRPTIITAATTAMASTASPVSEQQQQQLTQKDVQTPYRPIPNAKHIVKRGEALRLREASLLEKEQKLRDGTRQLEEMRRNIQLKLPPASSISSMLASETKST